MKNKKEHRALIITDKAKNNTFVDCEINGGAEVAGKGTLMIRTKINRLKELSKKHPLFSIVGLIGFIASIATIGDFLFKAFSR